MLYIVYNDMHDSATTMLMRCKVAVINGIVIGTKWCIYIHLRALRTPDQNITRKLSPVAQTDVRHRQSHCTTCKVRGLLRLAPIMGVLNTTHWHKYIAIYYIYNGNYMHACLYAQVEHMSACNKSIL